MTAGEFNLCAAEQPLFDEVGLEYTKHLDTLRGLIRSEVTRANLLEHLDLSRVRRAIDVGAGDGRDASWLASLGIDVVMIEPSSRMLEQAMANLERESEDVRNRVETFAGTHADAAREFGPHSFDLVVSHGVLMYQDDPGDFVRTMASMCSRDGVLSLLTKNAGALAFRPAMNGEYATALELLELDRSDGNLGVKTSAHDLQQIADWFFDSGVLVENWYGVRVFTDHLPDDMAAESQTVSDILRLETSASRRDPYRSASRLIHVIGRNARPEISQAA